MIRPLSCPIRCGFRPSMIRTSFISSSSSSTLISRRPGTSSFQDNCWNFLRRHWPLSPGLYIMDIWFSVPDGDHSVWEWLYSRLGFLPWKVHTPRMMPNDLRLHLTCWAPDKVGKAPSSSESLKFTEFYGLFPPDLGFKVYSVLKVLIGFES